MFLRSDSSLDCLQRVSIDSDAALIGVIEAGHEMRKRGLAAARRPHQRDRFSGFDRQVDVVQSEPVRAGIGEAHVLEPDRTRRLTDV